MAQGSWSNENSLQNPKHISFFLKLFQNISLQLAIICLHQHIQPRHSTKLTAIAYSYCLFWMIYDSRTSLPKAQHIHQASPHAWLQLLKNVACVCLKYRGHKKCCNSKTFSIQNDQKLSQIKYIRSLTYFWRCLPVCITWLHWILSSEHITPALCTAMPSCHAAPH